MQRFYPHTMVEEYINNPLDIKVETLSKEDKKFEQIFLGFRSVVGVREDILDTNELQKAYILTDEEKIYYKNGVFYNKDYFLADEITLFLSS